MKTNTGAIKKDRYEILPVKDPVLMHFGRIIVIIMHMQ